jgi:NhaP-type Na+/H+ or K+/H+ antiporter
MTQFFKGQKIFIFDEMIRESFEVRKVLSQKFNYLSIAYKVFFAALLIGILGYLAVLIYEYNFYEQMK